MPPKKRPVDRSKPSQPSSKVVDEVTALLQREVAARLGPDSTFEERRDVGARVMAEVLAGLSDEARAEFEARARTKGRS
jgi:hypothetical protein